MLKEMLKKMSFKAISSPFLASYCTNCRIFAY